MKKLFLTLGILSVLSLVANDLSAKEKTTTTTTTSPGSFSAGSFGCWGSGFCSTTTTTTTSCVMTTHDNGTITLDFDYNTFNKENQEYYNGRNVFENPQDYVLDAKTCQALELPEGTVVMKGVYPIRWQDNRMIFIANTNNLQ